MRMFGLVELDVAEAIEIYATREDAEEALAEVLRDEPGWEGLVTVLPVDLDVRFTAN
jgi:hypothetical protein